MVKLRGTGNLTFAKVNRILELLKESYPDMQNLSTIGSSLNMNHNTVKYFLERYLNDFVNLSSIGNMRLCLIRLKDDKKDSTISDVFRYWKIRKSLKSQV